MEQEETTGMDEFTEAAVEDNHPEDPQPEVKPEEKPAKADPEWDAERQRADQAEANFRRAQKEKQETEARLNQATDSVKALEEKLTQYAKENDVNLDSLDTDLVDPAMLKSLKAMKAQIDLANRKVQELETVAKTYEQREMERSEQSQRESAKNEIISDIEKEFSPTLRNQALEMADKVCKDRGSAPVDRYEAHKILRDCYRKLSAKKSGATPVASDKGTTTVKPQPKESEIKPGTLREVVSQHRARAGLT